MAIHLEGWADGDNQKKFAAHAQKLREYADLFEKYGGVLTLESKEIIDGCIRWDDNVLLELQQRGHAVGIHADSGGERNATTASITRDLADIKKKLNTLGIEPRFASGVASRADWVTACSDAGIEAVTCMVNYGLWALDPALRPDWFVPHKTPVQGHSHYPKEIEERLHGWLAGDGATWTRNDPNGSVLIIPSGLSLNNAYEEYVQGENTIKTEFTQEDIDAWAKALPVVLDAAEPGKVNTFYAVWSFGSPVDMELLEQWLQLIDGYVKQGRIRWANMDKMINLY